MTSAPGFVDTHAHIDDEQFGRDVDEVIDAAVAAGCRRIVNVACAPESWPTSIAIAARRPELALSFGLHPNSSEVFSTSMFEELSVLTARADCLAVGESGLDYYRDRAGRDVQIAAFTAQIELAADRQLPLILHLRGDVEADLVSILDKAPPQLRCILHAFEGSQRMRDYAVARSWMIGVGGLITRRKNRELLEIVATSPLENLLLETDSPYLAPTGANSRRNEPANVVIVAEHLARLKGVSVEAVFTQTTANAASTFGPNLLELR